MRFDLARTSTLHPPRSSATRRSTSRQSSLPINRDCQQSATNYLPTSTKVGRILSNCFQYVVSCCLFLFNRYSMKTCNKTLLNTSSRSPRYVAQRYPCNLLTRRDVSSIPANGIFLTKKLKTKTENAQRMVND